VVYIWKKQSTVKDSVSKQRQQQQDTFIQQLINVEQSGLPSKKYLDQMIGLITTIINYSTTVVSLIQIHSKEPRTAGTIQTSRCYQTSYLEL
jgi:hypothetical protein